MCLNGYEAVIAGNSCRWSCRPAGGNPNADCRTAADCPSDPTGVMIMCVGSWSCDAGSCNYACDTQEITTL
jgi:hypothetical protein